MIILVLILLLPIVTAIITLRLQTDVTKLRILNLGSSILTLGLVLWFLWWFNIKNMGVIENIKTKEISLTSIGLMKIETFISTDGISLIFVALTAILFPLCLLATWNINTNIKNFLICLQVLEVLIIVVFLMNDMFMFYIFFEIVLIPMFYIIINWGPNDRRVKAGLYFFVYTFVGSILLLLSIFIIYTEIGSTNFITIFQHNISHQKQVYLSVFLFFSFAVKIPMIPFHLWLPEAHVEAPTIGSVILAALLLKLGGYGFIRFIIQLAPLGLVHIKPWIFVLGLISTIYASIMAIRQVDLKRIIAYSSIAHMNIGVLGIFTQNMYGIIGSLLLMVAHGITSSALFFSVGVIYDRYHSRLLKYYSGLVIVMPIFILGFSIFNAANVSIPGTFNFVGEAVIFLGIGISKSWAALIITIFSTIIGLAYTLLFFNKISFGSVKASYIHTFFDITRKEWYYYGVLIILVILGGITPNSIFLMVETPIQNLLYASSFISGTTSAYDPLAYNFIFEIYSNGSNHQINFLTYCCDMLRIPIPAALWKDFSLLTDIRWTELISTPEEKYNTMSEVEEVISLIVYAELLDLMLHLSDLGIVFMVHMFQKFMPPDENFLLPNLDNWLILRQYFYMYEDHPTSDTPIILLYEYFCGCVELFNELEQSGIFEKLCQVIACGFADTYSNLVLFEPALLIKDPTPMCVGGVCPIPGPSECSVEAGCPCPGPNEGSDAVSSSECSVEAGCPCPGPNEGATEVEPSTTRQAALKLWQEIEEIFRNNPDVFGDDDDLLIDEDEKNNK